MKPVRVVTALAGDIDEVHVSSQALPMDQIWKKWGWRLGIPGRS
jgi:hypothetical protein